MSEELEIVDKDDKVIGRAPRHECHKNPDLLHRSAGALVFNSNGELLMQKRSMKKDTNPGKWSISSWGHLDIGESYEHAAGRELKEELGVSAELKQIFKIIFRVSYESEIFCIFKVVSDGPFKTDPEEVEKLEFMSMEDIKKHLAEDSIKFSGGCHAVLREYFKRFGEKPVI